jgi:PDZ domain-containing secreted protein
LNSILSTSSFDSLGSHSSTTRLALWANRFLILGILLFAGSIPHSIAAAHVSLDIALLAWITRAIAARRLQFQSTPIDKPLIGFAVFSVLSTIFSFEPDLSVRKLLSLLLFGVVYLFVSNLSKEGAKVVAAIILLSALVAVVYSLGEKLVGRGWVITSIDPSGPMSGSELRAGDVIWMLNRDSIHSLDDVREKIRAHRAGDSIEVEAIRRGDPLSLTIDVTQSMIDRENSLGLELGERNHRFRAAVKAWEWWKSSGKRYAGQLRDARDRLVLRSYPLRLALRPAWRRLRPGKRPANDV